MVKYGSFWTVWVGMMSGEDRDKRLSHRCASFMLLSPNNLRGKGLTPSPIRAETVPHGDEGVTEGGTIPGSRNLGAWLSHILTD